MILEAMKMEIDVVATANGTISKILTEPSKAVDEGQVLAVIA
jgi:pyruvate carboxylase subunit B